MKAKHLRQFYDLPQVSSGRPPWPLSTSITLTAILRHLSAPAKYAYMTRLVTVCLRGKMCIIYQLEWSLNVYRIYDFVVPRIRNVSTID